MSLLSKLVAGDKAFPTYARILEVRQNYRESLEFIVRFMLVPYLVKFTLLRIAQPVRVRVRLLDPRMQPFH